METVFAAAFFIVWFLLSFFFQFSSRTQKIVSHYDIFGLIPAWSFFAPNPGVSDWRLVYRLKHGIADFSGWKEVNLYSYNRYRFIWNPQKVETKSISDLIQCFFREHNELEFDLGKSVASRYYLSILNYILSKIDKQKSVYTEVQFCILKTSGFSERKYMIPVFVSPIHSVENDF